MDSADACAFVMDLFFNELSAYDMSENASAILGVFLTVVSEAVNQGFHGVRFEKGLAGVSIGYNYSLAQYCYEHSKEQSVKTLLAIQTQPFLEADQVDAFLIVDDFRVRDVSCEGLACAFINGSIGVGFGTKGWEGFDYKLDVYKDGIIEHTHTIGCLSSPNHFNEPLYIAWANQNLPPPELEKSKQIPLDKPIHLSEHHGMAELTEFSKKLRNDPYVEEIINSTDRNSDSCKFIASMHGNLIEMRLVRQGGFGLVVRTTAKNRRQLEAIANHLENKYNH